MTYLDANASEPLRPESLAAMVAALALGGNPSSVHGAGRALRRVLDGARHRIASAYGVQDDDVVFTSGGTEANALAITGLRGTRRVIVGATEHNAVRQAAPDAAVLPVDRDGVADLDALDRMLRDGPALVCLMAANNETGTRQPIAEAAALCRVHGALLHVDAVQARAAFDVPAMGAHSVALSAHKMGGPHGAGALLLHGADPAPLLRGGGQERGRRGGTPAVAALAGFAAAVGCAWPDSALRIQVESIAIVHGAVVLGGTDRLPNTACLALPGVRAEAQVIALDLGGVQVSAGAACSSGVVGESHVLRAMGVGRLATQAIRVSLPWNATAADVSAFGVAYAALAQRVTARAA